jgi:hypothetical protein
METTERKKKQKGNDRKKKPDVDRHKPTGNAKKPDVDRKEKNECGQAQTDVERWHRKKLDVDGVVRPRSARR